MLGRQEVLIPKNGGSMPGPDFYESPRVPTESELSEWGTVPLRPTEASFILARVIERDIPISVVDRQTLEIIMKSEHEIPQDFVEVRRGVLNDLRR